MFDASGLAPDEFAVKLADVIRRERAGCVRNRPRHLGVVRFVVDRLVHP